MRLSSGVADLVRKRARAQGPLSFADYVELALYSDPAGYYRRNVPGPGADYRTSPTLSPVFGRLLSRHLERMWEALDRPDPFRVTESGAGNAALALSVLQTCPNPLAAALAWCLVEPLPPLARLQRETLEDVHSRAGETGKDATEPLAPSDPDAGKKRVTDELRVEWVASLEELAPADGVVIANEVLDNMPFHILEVSESGLVEIRVAAEAGKMAEVPVPLELGCPLVGRAGDARRHLEPGDRFEVRPAADEWCRLAARTLNRGYLLVVDYGDTEPEIWTRHPAGTVATYRNEQLGFDPLQAPGETDITAHVNFSALGRSAAACGLEDQALLTQREWLKALGLGAVELDLAESQRSAEQAGDHAEALRLLAERSRAAALAYRGGLGDLKVFLAAKAAPPAFI